SACASSRPASGTSSGCSPTTPRFRSRRRTQWSACSRSVFRTFGSPPFSPGLGARVGEVEALVAELQESGIRESIQHDDLHDGQIFVREGHYRVLDWGDSCVSHPFHSLTVTLRAAAWKLGLEPGSAELLRMRDAYLEPFG